MQLFEDEADYAAFERVLAQAVGRIPGARLLAYCIMPNHWHLVLWPNEGGLLSQFMRWLTVTHTQRWHAHFQTSGTGPIYQGRFKSFPIHENEHLLTVMRYVERNPLRGGLVHHAEEWRWSSLWRWLNGSGPPSRGPDLPELAEWPVARPRGWLRHVSQPLTEAELAAVRRSVKRSAPYGPQAWTTRVANQLGLVSTLRPHGRPRKA